MRDENLRGLVGRSPATIVEPYLWGMKTLKPHRIPPFLNCGTLPMRDENAMANTKKSLAIGPIILWNLTYEGWKQHRHLLIIRRHLKHFVEPYLWGMKTSYSLMNFRRYSCSSAVEPYLWGMKTLHRNWHLVISSLQWNLTYEGWKPKRFQFFIRKTSFICGTLPMRDENYCRSVGPLPLRPALVEPYLWGMKTKEWLLPICFPTLLVEPYLWGMKTPLV